MPAITIEVPTQVYEELARLAGERGKSIEAALLERLATAVPLDALQPDEVRCSFCGKRRDEIRHLVAGREARICVECIDECARLIRRGLQEAQGEPSS